LIESRIQREYAECKVSVANLPLFVFNELIKFEATAVANFIENGDGSAVRFNPGVNYTNAEDLMDAELGFV